MKTIGAALLTLVALPAQADGRNATFEYTLTDLGTLSAPSTSFGCGPAALSLGGGNSTVNSISDNGEAVGFYCFRTATDPEGVYHGFRWTAHRGMVDLGFPQSWTDPATFVSPFGVNDKGEIAGRLREATGQDTAFFYDHGSMRVIGNPGDQAFAINNRGQVTGVSSVSGPAPHHAFLYFHGKRTDLATPPGALNSIGYAINDASHIAGQIDLDGGAPAHAALWTGASWRDLGVPAGDIDATAFGINLFDEVVGISFNSTTNHAFLWNGAFTILPCLSGFTCEAMSINNAGTIVGFSNVVAVVWLRGVVYDLNTLIDPHDPLHGHVRLYSASAVNARGQIAADGCYIAGPKDGQCFGFILDPTEDTQ
jgi:probable HAF family extracellular repeat protein